MSKRKPTESITSRQLSIFAPQFNERIRRKTHKGVEQFSLVDLMGEFSDLESRPDVLWKRTRERLAKDGFQYDQNVIQLKLKSPKDGKTYLTDCADGPTCLRIIQAIPSEKAEPIRQWLASLGYERLEEMRNPGLGTQRAKERDLALLKAQGYSNTEALQRLQDRIDTMSGYKSLMAAIKEVVEKPRYGDIVNAEYFALFGDITTGLQAVLNTKSVRDALPSLQLRALLYAESALQELIRQRDHMTMQQVISAVDKIVAPLGDHLRMVCETLNIDHITGKPLSGGAQ